MRILVEPSDYVLRNAGDMAMLQASVGRLHALWKDVRIQVLTRDPDTLRRLCPEAEPAPADGRAIWLSINHPAAPSLEHRIIAWARMRLQGRGRNEIGTFKKAVDAADLLVVAGMGGVTDAFPDYARDLLHTIAFAVRRKKYVAMMSQGIGPLSRPDLVRLAREVLPSVALIALRENLAGEPLLLSLGVSSDRIVCTGDDAIETAYNMRSDQTGHFLGVNVRISDYSGLDGSILGPLRSTFADLQATLETKMLALPISRVPSELDYESIAQLTPFAPADSDQFTEPAEVIARVNRCRVVVTGSYHAGVFALASGIPVVGLAKAPYYVDKFRGLQRQFGPGCEVVGLYEPDAMRELKDKVGSLWSAAEGLKKPLLAKAAEQIERGKAAYARVKREAELRLLQRG